jgi:hypothetical protein
MEGAAIELLPLSRSINSAFFPLTLSPRSLSSAFSSTTVIEDHAAEESGLLPLRIHGLADDACTGKDVETGKSDVTHRG